MIVHPIVLSQWGTGGGTCMLENKLLAIGHWVCLSPRHPILQDRHWKSRSPCASSLQVHPLVWGWGACFSQLPTTVPCFAFTPFSLCNKIPSITFPHSCFLSWTLTDENGLFFWWRERMGMNQRRETERESLWIDNKYFLMCLGLACELSLFSSSYILKSLHTCDSLKDLRWTSEFVRYPVMVLIDTHFCSVIWLPVNSVFLQENTEFVHWRACIFFY